MELPSDNEKDTGVSHNAATDVVAGEIHDVDPAWAKKVVRKIDKRIVLCCMMTFTMNFIDKILLGQSAIFGIRESTGLVGQQFSWLSSIFYFGYLLWEYPTTLLIQKLPVGKYLSGTVVCWGILVACNAASTNFAGLATVRFLLGFMEATAIPCFVYLVSQWYTRDEAPVRTGTWFVGADIGSIVCALVIYGLGHIQGGLEPWRYIFICFGIITFLWGVIMFFILPDTIRTAKFLTPEERAWAEGRVTKDGTGNLDPLITGSWKPHQVKEAFMDPKNWCIFVIYFLTQICNGGLQNFGNLVIKGFGFSPLDTVLFSIPGHFVSSITIWGSGWLSGRYRNSTTWLIMAVLAPPLAGSAIIYTLEGRGIRLFGYYLLQTGWASNPLSLALLASNNKGATKKMTVTAVLFLGYCAGNIAGPQFFKATEAPRYNSGFLAVMICFGLSMVTPLILRAYLMHKNRVNAAAFVAEDNSAETSSSTDGEDLTDWETKGFVYRL